MISVFIKVIVVILLAILGKCNAKQVNTFHKSSV